MRTRAIGPFERLARHTAVYATGDILVRAAAFLLIPLYTSHLTLDEFGVLGLVQMLEAALVLVLNMGLSTAVLKRATGGGDAETKADVFTAFVASVGVTVSVLGVGLLVGPELGDVLFGGALDTLQLAAVFAGIAAGTWKLFVLSLVRAKGNASLYVLVNLLHFLLLMGGSIYLVAKLEMGLAGAIVAQPIASGAALVVLLPFLRSNTEPRWRGAALRRLLAYGLPLMPGMLAMWVVTMSNRLVIQHLRDVAEVGVFTLAFRLALPLQIALVTPFRTAWLPVLFGLEKNGEIHRVASLALSYFLAVACFAALAIATFGPVLVAAIATPEYAAAAGVLPLLLAGFVLYGVYFNADSGVLLGQRTGLYPWIVGGAAVVNVGLNVLLVDRWGIVGAGVAQVVSYALLSAVMFAASQRVHPIRYDVRRASIPPLVALALYALAVGPAAGAHVALRGLLVAAYPVALVLLGFFRAPERRRLRELLGSRR